MKFPLCTVNSSTRFSAKSFGTRNYVSTGRIFNCNFTLSFLIYIIKETDIYKFLSVRKFHQISFINIACVKN